MSNPPSACPATPKPGKHFVTTTQTDGNLICSAPLWVTVAERPCTTKGNAMGMFDRLFGPPSRDRFGQMVLAAMKKGGEPSKLTFDSEKFRIVIHDDSSNQIGEFFLGNVYREYCERPTGERPAFFATVVRSTFARHKELPEDFDDAKPDILPVLRSWSFYHGHRIKATVNHSDDRCQSKC